MIAALLVTMVAAPNPTLRIEAVEITVVEGKAWEAEAIGDIKATLDSTAKSLLKHFPKRKLKPILVEYGEGTPITLFQRGPRDETMVRLGATKNYWVQYAYQFSHELTHILCGIEKIAPNSPPNLWFEESLCMMASIFTMRQMAEDWKTEPPFSTWKDYAPNFGRYANGIMNRTDYQLPEKTSFAQWYQDNEEKLRNLAPGTAESRRRQSVVANVLLPLFEATPEHWPAIGYLNAKTTGNSSFDGYMDAWEASAPAKHRLFIRKIRVKFGRQ